jgi:hypothetical protein
MAVDSGPSISRFSFLTLRPSLPCNFGASAHSAGSSMRRLYQETRFVTIMLIQSAGVQRSTSGLYPTATANGRKNRRSRKPRFLIGAKRPRRQRHGHRQALGVGPATLSWCWRPGNGCPKFVSGISVAQVVSAARTVKNSCCCKKYPALPASLNPMRTVFGYARVVGCWI